MKKEDEKNANITINLVSELGFSAKTKGKISPKQYGLINEIMNDNFFLTEIELKQKIADIEDQISEWKEEMEIMNSCSDEWEYFFDKSRDYHCYKKAIEMLIDNVHF